MLSSSSPTSKLSSKRILYPMNTLVFSQTQTEPLIPMVYLGQIYVPNTDNLQLRVLQYSHDHPLAEHFSQKKLLHQVQQHYFWPGLPIYVKDYCRSCTICC